MRTRQSGGESMDLRQALLRAVLAAVAAMLVFAGPSFGVRGAASSAHGSLRDFSKATAHEQADGRPARGGQGASREGDMEQLRHGLDADASRRLPDQAGSGSHRGGRGSQLACEAQGDLPARPRARPASRRGLEADRRPGARGHLPAVLRRPEGRQRSRPDHRLDGAGQAAPSLEDRLRQLDLARHAALDRRRQAVGGAGLRARGRQPRAEDDPREREGTEGRPRLDEPPRRRLP